MKLKMLILGLLTYTCSFSTINYKVFKSPSISIIEKNVNSWVNNTNHKVYKVEWKIDEGSFYVVISYSNKESR